MSLEAQLIEKLRTFYDHLSDAETAPAATDTTGSELVKWLSVLHSLEVELILGSAAVGLPDWSAAELQYAGNDSGVTPEGGSQRGAYRWFRGLWAIAEMSDESAWATPAKVLEKVFWVQPRSQRQKFDILLNQALTASPAEQARPEFVRLLSALRWAKWLTPRDPSDELTRNGWDEAIKDLQDGPFDDQSATGSVIRESLSLQNLERLLWEGVSVCHGQHGTSELWNVVPNRWGEGSVFGYRYGTAKQWRHLSVTVGDKTVHPPLGRLMDVVMYPFGQFDAPTNKKSCRKRLPYSTGARIDR